MFQAVVLTATLAAVPAYAASEPAQPRAQALSGPSIDAFAAKLVAAWVPNCDAEGADTVVIRVGFVLSKDGRVAFGPVWMNRRDDPVWDDAARRAYSAVTARAPYIGLPASFYGERIEINFDQRNACHR